MVLRPEVRPEPSFAAARKLSEMAVIVGFERFRATI
jgi:hypothetical protein